MNIYLGVRNTKKQSLNLSTLWFITCVVWCGGWVVWCVWSFFFFAISACFSFTVFFSPENSTVKLKLTGIQTLIIYTVMEQGFSHYELGIHVEYAQPPHTMMHMPHVLTILYHNQTLTHMKKNYSQTSPYGHLSQSVYRRVIAINYHQYFLLSVEPYS